MFRMILAGFRDHKPWLLFFILAEVLFGIFLWLAAPHAFYPLLGVMLLGCTLLLGAQLMYTGIKDKKRRRAVMAFLEDPCPARESEALKLSNPGDQAIILTAGILFGKNMQKLKDQSLSLTEYEEYVESWAHEIKTPLSLMTLILDNRRDMIPSSLFHRLEYIRNQMQEDVDQMLCYARLKSSHKDYLFEKILLPVCCSDVLQEYQVFFKEMNFQINTEIPNLEVLSDKKGLEFILKQIISNSVKYARAKEQRPLLSIQAHIDYKKAHVLLEITDNGIGVSQYDLPFIFEKGYTGDTGGQRMKATGMGLYLLKQIADDLKIEVAAASEGQSFQITLIFPIV